MPQVRNACLSIGIANAGGGLEYLGGAINGAVDMHRWAEAQGYTSYLLVDDSEPVDIQRLKEAIEALLPRGTATERLILYFAGHGFISQADEGLWLLSDWSSSLRAVAVEPLRRRLRAFGIKQISIIADACRVLPPTMKVADLAQDPVLGAGFTQPQTDLVVDRFTASQNGKASYMIPGDQPELDKCVFSGVLMEGLWGLDEEAFSKRAQGQVISTSLADYLRIKVPEVARRYQLQMAPEATTGFPELQDIYFDRKLAPPAPPKLGAWPTPTWLKPDATAMSAPDDADVTLHKVQRAVRASIREVDGRNLAITKDTPLGANGLRHSQKKRLKYLDAIQQKLFDMGIVLGAVSPTLFTDTSINFVRDVTARVMSELATESENRLTAPSSRGTLRTNDQERRRAEWLVARQDIPAQQQRAKDQDELQRSRTLDLLRAASVPKSHSIHEGLVIAGMEVAAVWVPPNANALLTERDWVTLLEIDLPSRGSQQLVVELQNGNFVPCTVMSGMVTRLGVDETGGAAALAMQTSYGRSNPEVQASIDAGERAIASLASGLDVKQASDLAANLRMGKHLNPVLGVISAYLYDAVGDQESIRRMAYYYVYHSQAVPFDIAFLADLEVEAARRGALGVRVPAQPAREPRTEREASLGWTTKATTEVRGTVAGRLPWMRRGWPYINVPTESERLMTWFLADMIAELRPARFTTLDPYGGHKLVEILSLERRACGF